jgi:hypothetical protein
MCGGGHAAELAYMWPSFDNGIPIAATFNAAERRLAHDMVAWWGNFVRTGAPGTVDGTAWPRLDASLGPKAQLLSLRAGGRSTPITTPGSQPSTNATSGTPCSHRSRRHAATLRSEEAKHRLGPPVNHKHRLRPSAGASAHSRG